MSCRGALVCAPSIPMSATYLARLAGEGRRAGLPLREAAGEPPSDALRLHYLPPRQRPLRGGCIFMSRIPMSCRGAPVCAPSIPMSATYLARLAGEGRPAGLPLQEAAREPTLRCPTPSGSPAATVPAPGAAASSCRAFLCRVGAHLCVRPRSRCPQRTSLVWPARADTQICPYGKPLASHPPML